MKSVPEKRIYGRVIRTTGSFSTVLAEDGNTYECKLKGSFRIKGLRTTNPIAAGDFVFLTRGDGGGYIIDEICARTNYIIRKSINLSSEAQIIAANLDQAILVATIHSPRTSYGFIDRFLITCEAYEIPALIFVNKADLLNPEQMQSYHDLEKIYQEAGYRVILISALEGTGLTEIKQILYGKTTLFSGHSGSGKSSLINSLFPGLNIRTGQISDVHLKGKHTTTFAEMHMPEKSIAIIDTPGIRELGLIDMEPNEIRNYFPEFRNFASECRFSDCMHRSEPSCGVRKAAEENRINVLRYISYLGILDSEELKK